MKIRIICIKTDEGAFNAEIKDKLVSFGYDCSVINEFSFCPCLVCHPDFEDQKKFVCENYNEGYMRQILLSGKADCKAYKTSEEFISAALEMIKSPSNGTSSLF